MLQQRRKELDKRLVESRELHSKAIGLEMETARLRADLQESKENWTGVWEDADGVEA